MSDFLRAVSAPNRALACGPVPHIEPALNAWLAGFGQAARAARCSFYDQIVHSDSGLPTLRRLAEWAAPGVSRIGSSSFRDPYVIDPRGAESLIDTMLRGAPAVIDVLQISEPLRSFLRCQGNRVVVMVPVWVSEHRRLWISLDYQNAIAIGDDLLQAFVAVADTLAALLLRLETESRLAQERERRLLVERSRNQKIALANRTLAVAARQLVDTAGVNSFATELVQQVRDHFGACRVVVVRLFDARGQECMEVVAEAAEAVVGGPEPAADVPTRLSAVDRQQWLTRLAGTVELRTGMRTPSELHPIPALAVWHAAHGHRVALDVPLRIGDELMGVLIVAYRDLDQVARHDQGLLVTLAGMLAVALQIERLVEERQRVQTQALAEARERERLIALIQTLDAMQRSSEATSQAELERAFTHTLKIVGDSMSARLVYLMLPGAGSGRAEIRGVHPLERSREAERVKDSLELQEGMRALQRDVVGSRQAAFGRMLRNVAHTTARPFEPSSQAEAALLAILERLHASEPGDQVSLRSLTTQRGLYGVVVIVQPGQVARKPVLEGVVNILCEAMTLALALRQASEDARRLAEQSAVMGERDRIARDLHDSIGQTFVAIQMQLSMVEESPPALERAATLARNGLVEIRRVVDALTPYALLQNPLPRALQAMLVDVADRTGLQVALDVAPGWPALGRFVEAELYRIAQEAVQNSVKHASARRISIDLSRDDIGISMLVSDDGVGMPAREALQGGGLGLHSMQYRCAQLGGEIQIISASGSGTQVLVTLSQHALQAVSLGADPADSTKVESLL